MPELIARSKVTIEAPASEVWQALTDPDVVAKYMFGARVVTDWKEGSPITYEGEWQGKRYQDKGTVLKVVPNEMLKTTHFSPLSGQPDVPENYHVVTYGLTAEGDHTVVSVTQENNPDEKMVEESEKNWSGMLNELKKVVESDSKEGR